MICMSIIFGWPNRMVENFISWWDMATIVFYRMIIRTGARVETLSPLEGLTDEQLTAGEDYFSVMEQSLASLKDALS